MRVVSVVGARPNFMKVAPIHRAFLEHAPHIEHHLVHTGQHYDAAMSDAFFADLDMPHPSWFLGVGSGSHAEQTARVMTGFDEVCMQAKPDYVIVVGDVNSTVACALVAVKRGIRTGHVEAGLRSFDRTMPEEINRLATDAICDDLFITEESAQQHLLHEGHSPNRVHFVGNTMIDSLHYALPKSDSSTVHDRHGLTKNNYVLVTLHRPSNVDDAVQLQHIINTLNEIATTRQVVFPVHPRTRGQLKNLGVLPSSNVLLIDPVGYVDFLALMRYASVVLTDSGGIQEETTALGVPCVTARTSTERPSTITIGTNVLVAPERTPILEAVHNALTKPKAGYSVPPLWDGHAADRIVGIIARHYS